MPSSRPRPNFLTFGLASYTPRRRPLTAHKCERATSVMAMDHSNCAVGKTLTEGVLTIATGRNTPDGIKRFFADAGVDSLPRHQDPKQALASQMGIFGLPITVIMDPEGREIARLRGDADWSSDSAKAIVQALIAGKADS